MKKKDKKDRKPFSETVFGKIVNGVKDHGVDVLGVAAKVASGNVVGAVNDVKSILSGKESIPEVSSALKELELRAKEIELEHRKYDIEEFSAETKDRERATDLFKHDNVLQKVFAVTFLIGYFLITIMMFYGAYLVAVEGIKLDNYMVALVTSTFTAMSTKVNTIVDFLFGGSVGGK